MASLRAYLLNFFTQLPGMVSSRAFSLATRCLLLPMSLAIIIIADGANSSSHAASCSSLKSQLASLNGNRGGGGSKRYQRAAKSQSKQIDKVRRKMDSYGCSRKRKFFKREKHASCRGLRSTLRKMKSNLKALNRKAGQLSSGKGNARKKRSLKRAMRRNNCDGNVTKKASVKRTTIIEQIFGRSASKRRREQAARDREELKRDRQRQKKKSRIARRSTEDRLKNYNTIRTVCVRRCDGYYFPVSFSTTKGLMDKDAEACSNLCPGTQMDMYFHKTKGESADQMISMVDGTPYSELPNAFAYRENYDPDCSCNYRLLARKKEQPDTQPTAKELAKRERSEIERMAAPAWRVDQGQDPETLANAEGSFDDETIKRLNPDNDTKQVAETRRVRVIGEEFLPTQ